jgi:hypothetical protein
MFPSNDGNFGSTPGSPFGGFGGAGGANGHGGSAGGPPPADAIFESAFEEFDEDAIDALIAADEARHEAKYEFLSVGLHFYNAVKNC